MANTQAPTPDEACRVNQGGANGFTLDVQVWDGRHARYLVHGARESLWTNDPREVADFIASELAAIEIARG